jgi:hypothetical protein
MFTLLLDKNQTNVTFNEIKIQSWEKKRAFTVVLFTQK